MKKLTALLFIIIATALLACTNVLAYDGIEKQSKTFSPTSGNAESITVTTANKFQNGYSLIFEIDNLQFDSYSYRCHYNYNDSEYIENVYQLSGEKGCLSISNSEYHAGMNTVTFSIHSTDNSICYDNISFEIKVCETLPGDGYLSFDTANEPEGTFGFSFSFYSETSYKGKYAKILGKDGQIYAVLDDSVSAWNTTIPETRYADVFHSDIFDTYMVKYGMKRTGYHNDCYFYNCRYLKTGSYDVVLYDGGTEVFRISDAVTITSLPLIYITEPYESFPQPCVEDTAFYLNVTLANSTADDFGIQLYNEENVLVAADTGEWLCIHADASGKEYEYCVKMQTVEPSVALKDEKYTYKAVSNKKFIFKNKETDYLWPFAKEQMVNVVAPDDRYANFFIRTYGGTDNDGCKFELSQDGECISSVIQFPAPDGSYDIEFADENGTVISLDNYASYCIKMYHFDEFRNEWKYYGNMYYYTNRVGESDGETAAYPEISGYVGTESKYLNICAYIKKEAAGDYLDSNFKVQATAKDGSVYTFEDMQFSRNTINDGARISLWCRMDVSDQMPYGYYTFKLLYGDTVIYDAQYNSQYSSAPDYAYTSQNVNDVKYTKKVWLYGIEDKTSAKLLLFDPYHWNSYPMYTLTLDSINEYSYNISNTTYDMFEKYYYQIIADGKLVYSNLYNADYFMPFDYEASDAEYTVTAEECTHGSISVSSGTAKCSEYVYVTVNPDEGYEYVPNSVKINGKSINGRSFVVSGNSSVTADFRPLSKPKYSVAVYEYIYNGSLSLDKNGYTEGETVTVNVEPEKGYKLSRLYYEDFDNNCVEIPIDSCAFSMPAFAVELHAEFERKCRYYIYEEFNDYEMYMLYDGEDTNSIYEGDEVTVGVYLKSNNSAVALSEIESLYFTVSGNDTQYPITDGKFIMPESDIQIYCTLKKHKIEKEITGEGDIWCVDSAYAGETVDLHCYAYGSFQLVPGSLKVNGIAMDDDSFIMPGSDVMITAEFVSDTYRSITIPQIEHGWIYISYGTYQSGADIGSSVRLQVYIDEGYRLNDLKYNGVSVTEKEYDGYCYYYSFTMPAEDVVIASDIVLDVYDVKFKNFDGSVLYQCQVKKGESAEYLGAVPTRPIANGKAYLFYDWDKDFTGITEDTEILALFTEYEYKEIHNEAELNQIRNNLSGYYVLANDITLENPWTPIGGTTWTGEAFYGILDGNKHVIHGIRILPSQTSEGTEYAAGFFNELQNAHILNLGLEITLGGDEDSHDGEAKIGGLAASAYNTKISRCFVTGSIQSNADYRHDVGGLIGSADHTNINDCYTNVEVLAGGPYVFAGGLIGVIIDTEIENCYSRGFVTTTSGSTGTIGGLIGEKAYLDQKSNIKNCYYANDKYITHNGFGEPETGEYMQRYECYADYVELDGMVVAQYQWDFDHIWTLDKKVNDGFPSLRFVETETDIVLKETLHSPNVNLIEIEFSISKSVKGGLILAGYDDAGRLVAVNNTNCITSETYTDGSRYKLYYDKEPEVVKVMVWETDGSMKPACAALEFHVDGVPINIPQ